MGLAIKSATNDDIVAGGLYFKAVFNLWEIGVFIVVLIISIYLIRQKRKMNSLKKIFR